MLEVGFSACMNFIIQDFDGVLNLLRLIYSTFKEQLCVIYQPCTIFIDADVTYDNSATTRHS